jgi:putative protease
MKKEIELLAPGGNPDSIKAAIAAGADAVYCGLNRFNARNRAQNFDFEELTGIINLAHKNNCKVFLTLNIIIVGDEIKALFNLLNNLVNTKIDGVIVQDLGVFYILSTCFKSLEIHASTQLTTHNIGQISFLKKLGASRVNLSRELNIDEIKAITKTAHYNGMLTEVFVHGSYCISFSGLCYISSLLGGNSANRGRCSQPCRDRYITTPAGKDFPLNMKDNSAFSDLEELSRAGVDSLKIEGRIKNSDYVYTAVNTWRNRLDAFYDQKIEKIDNSDFYKVFNRDFSNGYLMGDINKNMFIDNPRDYSIKHFSKTENSSGEKLEKVPADLYEEKDRIGDLVRNKVRHLSISKDPLVIDVSGENGVPLKVIVKTFDTSFTLFSKESLKPASQIRDDNNKKTLDHDFLSQRFKALNTNDHFIKDISVDNLERDLFLSFKEITSIKNKILSNLSGSETRDAPVKTPLLKKNKISEDKPTLSVLISSIEELYLCNETSASIFFQLPDCLNHELLKYIELFSNNKRIIPWFPSVMIGKDYEAAIEFLDKVKPELIVTNNTGVAYEAFKQKISWIAGPYMNIANSFSLLCLKEKFNCCGAFISNELSRVQIKNIVRPENFKLYYSIYNPIVLMTSRQCLFHQVTGCEKNKIKIDDDCIKNCNKSATITDLKKRTLYIDKSTGNYHCVYNDKNYLNTEIIKDFPGLFSSFLIDLRDIKTNTDLKVSKPEAVSFFTKFLDGDFSLENELVKIFHGSTNTQYKKGI